MLRTDYRTSKPHLAALDPDELIERHQRIARERDRRVGRRFAATVKRAELS